ncbi:PaaI family thioesterase [Pseudomonas sp.]|uniref:PaaI family thioesterase n=1 Tax=Pseudomonas sp. TaxID=306 RepID=UPI002FCB81D2
MTDSPLAHAPNAATDPGPVFPGARFSFQEFIGLERWAQGEVAHIRLQHREELMNYLGHFHGGVLMTVLDAAMAGAIRIHAPGCTMVTIDMATHFLGAARSQLNAVGRVLRQTRNLCFCTAEIRNEDGELIATASGCFKYRPVQAANRFTDMSTTI